MVVAHIASPGRSKGESMRHRAPVSAVLVTLALLATACGDDDTADDPPAADTGATPEGTTGDTTGDTTGGSDGEAPTGEPIVFGMVVDSTGPGASYSVPARDTMLDAIEEINAGGGVLGRPIETIIENDESDPTRTPATVRKLVEDGADVLIMQTGGSAILQAKPVIQEAGIPMIAPTTLTTSIAEPPDADFAFTLANPIDDFIDIYCAAWAEAGVSSIGVLSDTTPTIAGLNELLLPGLGECVDIAIEEEAAVDASDLTAQIARIGDADIDAVLVSSVGGGFEVLAHNTFAQQLPDLARFSLAAIGNQPETWELANPGALDGLVFMGSIDPTNERTEELRAFLSERRDDDWQLTAYDAQAYDTIQLLAMAIESAETSDDPAAITEALQSITGYEAHFGQPGFTLSYGPDKHVGTDGLCGLSLIQFGAENTPEGQWDVYQPEC
jgi:branched-chain amino acid transport system substrate-binding protein